MERQLIRQCVAVQGTCAALVVVADTAPEGHRVRLRLHSASFVSTPPKHPQARSLFDVP